MISLFVVHVLFETIEEMVDLIFVCVLYQFNKANGFTCLTNISFQFHDLSLSKTHFEVFACDNSAFFCIEIIFGDILC